MARRSVRLPDDAFELITAREQHIEKHLLPLHDLTLEAQPRELVPEERLQALIAADAARPSALLTVLEEEAARDAYYAAILEGLRGLAASIASQGVLQPVEVVFKKGRWVLRDGHRRSLASLLAGKETIPAIEIEEPTELEAIARPLIVNVQRQDLTAVEKGAALLRLALLVGRRLVEEGSVDNDGQVTLDLLLGDAGSEAEEGTPPLAADGRTITGTSRALAGQIRERVCEMVGLSRMVYYQLLWLNRLTPEARAAGRGLTEFHLRPVTRLPAEYQAEIVDFAVRRKLSGKEVATLAQVARSGDRDAIQRVMARLAREERGRPRIAPSWEPLLHAVPRDFKLRCQALRVELIALPPAARAARLEAIQEQVERLPLLQEELAAIITELRERDAATDDRQDMEE